MPFSARNRIREEVTHVESASPMGRVDIDAGDAGDPTAAVTNDSAESLDLSAGDGVEAVVGATPVTVDAGG